MRFDEPKFLLQFTEFLRFLPTSFKHPVHCSGNINLSLYSALIVTVQVVSKVFNYCSGCRYVQVYTSSCGKLKPGR